MVFSPEIGKETKNQLVLDQWFETTSEKSDYWFTGPNQWIKKAVFRFFDSNHWCQELKCHSRTLVYESSVSWFTD